MIEAPERIWAFHVRVSGLEFGEWVEDPSDTASGTEYVRADRIEALERELAEGKRRNAELDREITGLRNSYWEERKAHLAAQADKARLSEALRPFADMGDLIESETTGFADTDEFDLLYAEMLFNRFKIGDFRAARAALSGSNFGKKDV